MSGDPGARRPGRDPPGRPLHPARPIGRQGPAAALQGARRAGDRRWALQLGNPRGRRALRLRRRAARGARASRAPAGGLRSAGCGAGSGRPALPAAPPGRRRRDPRRAQRRGGPGQPAPLRHAAARPPLAGAGGRGPDPGRGRMIIDAHHHLWRLSWGDYGWLTPDLAPLWRDFEPADLAPLMAAAGMAGGILVQAAPTEAETAFLLGLAARTPTALGVTGWTDFAAPDAPDTIARLAADPRLKGLRPMLQDLA